MSAASPTTQCGLAACLMTSHFWAEALAVLSVTAQLVATVSGAIIGLITLYRMWRNHKQAMPAKAVAFIGEHMEHHDGN